MLIKITQLTHVSMATKYPIIKHRAFFKTFTFLFPQKKKKIGQIFLPELICMTTH